MKKLRTLSLITFSSLLILLLFGQSCEDSHLEEVQNLNQGKVQRIGHAGLGFVSLYPFNPYPANSFKALKLALEKHNADGIEVDLQMTADNRLVLYHDNYLHTKTQLNNCVSSYTYNELVRTPYQVGVPYDWFQSEQIIGLDSLLSYLEEFHSQAFLHIDIRHYSLCLGPKENEQRMYGLVDTLLECLHRSEFPLENILLNSSSFELCNYIKEESKEIAVSFEVIEDVEMWLPKVHAAGIKFVTIKPRLLNKELSRRIHNKGIQIVTFGGARKKWNIELLRKDPDIIQTNDLSSLNELLHK